jgi:hypothetical protein
VSAAFALAFFAITVPSSGSFATFASVAVALARLAPRASFTIAVPADVSFSLFALAIAATRLGATFSLTFAFASSAS